MEHLLLKLALFTCGTLVVASPKLASTVPVTTGKVTYTFVTKLRGNPIDQPAELLFSEAKSVFIYAKGKTGFVAKEVKIKDQNGQQQTVQDGYFQEEGGSVVYKDLKKRACIVREIVWMQPYLTAEPTLPQVDWTIETDQRKIGSFTAQKAIANFRGRTYTAWFCPQIPVNDGPWKLHGLPGLILEATDATGEVQFLFKSIDIPFETGPIMPPTTGQKVSFDEYKRADELEFLKMKKQTMANQEGKGQLNVTRQPVNLIEKVYEP